MTFYDQIDVSILFGLDLRLECLRLGFVRDHGHSGDHEYSNRLLLEMHLFVDLIYNLCNRASNL